VNRVCGGGGGGVSEVSRRRKRNDAADVMKSNGDIMLLRADIEKTHLRSAH